MLTYPSFNGYVTAIHMFQSDHMVLYTGNYVYIYIHIQIMLLVYCIHIITIKYALQLGTMNVAIATDNCTYLQLYIAIRGV